MNQCAAAAVAVLLAWGCAGEPRGPCQPNPAPGEVGSICGFSNPEDIEWLPRAGVLVVSQMPEPERPGSLVALVPGPLDAAPRPLWPLPDAATAPHPDEGDPACATPPLPEHFAPHGIAAGPPRPDGSVLLAVVAHGPREAIELFRITGSGDGARAEWRGCVELPPETTGNDVAFGSDGGLIAPSYQPTTEGFSGAYWTVRGGVGWATGQVMLWRPGAGWSRLPESDAPQPNGVLHSPDDGLVFVAETGSGRVAVLDARPDPGAAVERRKIEIGGYPDNLAWSREGRVLAITHRAGVGVLLCKLGRLPCRTAWSLFEIDPASLAPRERLRHDGSALGAASSVAEAAGRFYFGAVFDDRIGVWRPGA